MLAIIPARGGSKGLPGKNIRNLHGKPMIAYTIEAALQAKHISRVIVSTDCEEIAAEALLYGAEVPFMRPPQLASDESLAVDTYLYTIDRIQNESGGTQTVDCLMILLPTCPLRNAKDIDAAVNLFVNKDADSVISYVREQHPISWHRYVDHEGRLHAISPETLANRQSEKASYYPNGAMYIFKEALLRQKKYFSDNSFAYLMPRNRSIDVDTLDDFEYIEFLMSR